MHSDFIVSETILHLLVADCAQAIPEKCKGKLLGVIVELSRVISNWEKSEQKGRKIDVVELLTEQLDEIKKELHVKVIMIRNLQENL